MIGLKATPALILCCSRYDLISRPMFQVLSVLQYSLSVSMSTYGNLTIVEDPIQRKDICVVLVHPALEVTHEGLEELHLWQGEEFIGMTLHIVCEVEQEESNELREGDVFDEDVEMALKLIQILESQPLQAQHH